MTTNPFYNALFAIAYIVVLVTGVNFFANTLESVVEETILLPMGVLGILVFSVALMAYLFFYQPVILLLDGAREKAVRLFLHTVGMFAGGTAVIFLVSFIVSRLGNS